MKLEKKNKTLEEFLEGLELTTLEEMLANGGGEDYGFDEEAEDLRVNSKQMAG